MSEAEPVRCDGCDAHEPLWSVPGSLLCKTCLYDDEGIVVAGPDD